VSEAPASEAPASEPPAPSEDSAPSEDPRAVIVPSEAIVAEAAPSEVAVTEAPAEPAPVTPIESKRDLSPFSERKPLLASEALMEDLAPVEPGRRSARLWCAGLGGGFTLFGVLPLVDLRPGGLHAAVPWLVLGGIALVAALSQVTYRQRAVAMVVLGLLSGIVGLHGTAVAGAGSSLTRLVPAIALSAALVFRARYRAYTGARVFLGIALLLCGPFVVFAALGFSGGFGVAQVGSIVALATIAASLVGFMGAETTGAGPYLSFGIVIAFAIELALRALFSPDAQRTVATIADVLGGALAFAGASTLAALGLFQILAWRFAADARRIDLHSPPAESNKRQDSEVDWATRE
jgi:hypothetical protein